MILRQSEMGSRITSSDMERVEAKMADLNSIVYPVFKPDPKHSPILQVLYMYEVRNAKNEPEFRLTLADGFYLQRAVLANELNEEVKSMALVIKAGSIIRIHEYTLHASVHQELKRLIKIRDMEVLVTNFDPIGRSLSYFTSNWLQLEQMEWNEPQDWNDDNWEWLDPADPDHEWEEDE